MRLVGFFLACCLCAGLRADDDRAEKIGRFVQSGEASYLKADYEAAQYAYEEAWKIAQETASADPARYTLLKRLTVVHSIAGRYDEAENYLQQIRCSTSCAQGWQRT